MRKTTIKEGRRCPICGEVEHQVNAGRNRSGTQRCFCNDCKKYYTLGAKAKAYTDEIQQNALKMYYSGVSGRGVGRILGMSKANVYNWIKKNGSDGG